MANFKAAVIQLNSTGDIAGNLADAATLVRLAAGEGARFVLTPEHTPYLGPEADKLKIAEPLDGEICAQFSKLASDLGIYLCLGSFAEKPPVPNLCRNTSVLFGPTGEVLSTYSKIHLFDVGLENGPLVRESDTVMPGAVAVVCPTPLARLGFSICYDLRFPGLYTVLREAGAEVILAPSAFTSHTGKDHWELLLCARAVETQCYVMAAAQVGYHASEQLKESYGHSLIVDPWGKILARVKGGGPGYAIAEIDMGYLEKVRTAMPVTMHRRF